MVQIFGQDELIDHIQDGCNYSSHLISIGNPKSLFIKNGRGETLPKLFKQSFQGILRLSFYDVEYRYHLTCKQFPKIIPTRNHVQKAIDFYNKTKDKATGYTIHCWRGVSRSAAIAVGILYHIHKDEKKVFEELLKIRPQAMPHRSIVKYYDDILGCNLTAELDIFRQKWIDAMKAELNFNPDDYLEELEEAELEEVIEEEIEELEELDPIEE
jgi:predicted protein tyrosine phosphatase